MPVRTLDNALHSHTKSDHLHTEKGYMSLRTPHSALDAHTHLVCFREMETSPNQWF